MVEAVPKPLLFVVWVEYFKVEKHHKRKRNPQSFKDLRAFIILLVNVLRVNVPVKPYSLRLEAIFVSYILIFVKEMVIVSF